MNTPATVAELAEPGFVLPPFRTQPLEHIRIEMFSFAMRDPNPVHLDDDFARGLGLPSVIAPGGVAVVALANLVARWAGREAIEEIDVRFRSPIPVGERLVCTGHVERVDEGRVQVACRATGEGDELRAEGTIWLRCGP